MYLSGLDWPEWTAPTGNYVTMQGNAAKAHRMVPMFTLYQAAANGEGNLGAFDAPAIVHVEPGLWGYTQSRRPSRATSRHLRR